ncbi:hypothetical protein Q7C36_002905, partial [Tachysurus vachellii]
MMPHSLSPVVIKLSGVQPPKLFLQMHLASQKTTMQCLVVLLSSPLMVLYSHLAQSSFCHLHCDDKRDCPSTNASAVNSDHSPPISGAIASTVSSASSNNETRTPYSDSKISLKGIMEKIVSRINNDETVRFNIIRRNVWDGTSRAMDCSNFAPEKKMDIKFTDDYGISEGAIDNGGPTREFFRLCLYEIKDNIGIFEGSRQCTVKARIEHINDDETRSQVQSILEAETESQLEDAIARAASLISLVGHNVLVTLKTKEETAMDLAHWY